MLAACGLQFVRSQPGRPVWMRFQASPCSPVQHLWQQPVGPTGHLPPLGTNGWAARHDLLFCALLRGAQLHTGSGVLRVKKWNNEVTQHLLLLIFR